MDWRGVLLLGIGANLDNLGVGISYGMRGIKVRWQANAVIAGIALVATGLATAAGNEAAALLPLVAAKRVGAAILLLVGLWIGLEAWLEHLSPSADGAPQRLLRVPVLGAPGVWIEILRDPQKADVDRSGAIDLREAALLGIALSLNNVGTGLGGGLGHYPVLATALVTAVGSWVTVSGGAWLGRRSSVRWLGEGASYAATFVLVVLAIIEWV